MVDGEFYIAPGQKFKSRFRFHVHQGEPDLELIEKIQTDLADPVKVRSIE
jgi:hypothetical protein